MLRADCSFVPHPFYCFQQKSGTCRHDKLDKMILLPTSFQIRTAPMTKLWCRVNFCVKVLHPNNNARLNVEGIRWNLSVCLFWNNAQGKNFCEIIIGCGQSTLFRVPKSMGFWQQKSSSPMCKTSSWLLIRRVLVECWQFVKRDVRIWKLIQLNPPVCSFLQSFHQKMPRVIVFFGGMTFSLFQRVLYQRILAEYE